MWGKEDPSGTTFWRSAKRLSQLCDPRRMTTSSGLSLDRQWDLYVDESTGDLAFSRASQEIRKDLAFNIGRVLSDEVGKFMDQGRRADIERHLAKVVESDPRIAQVDSIRVQALNRSNELDVDMIATVEDEADIDGDGEVETITLDRIFTTQ